jgi:hypothetical protein
MFQRERVNSVYPNKIKKKKVPKKKEISGRGSVAPALAASGYRLEDAARAPYTNR